MRRGEYEPGIWSIKDMAPSWFGLLVALRKAIKTLQAHPKHISLLTNVPLQKVLRLCSQKNKVWQLDLTIAETHAIIVALRTMYAHKYRVQEEDNERAETIDFFHAMAEKREPSTWKVDPSLAELDVFFSQWGFPIETSFLGFDDWLPSLDELSRWQNLTEEEQSRTLARSAEASEIPRMTTGALRAAARNPKTRRLTKGRGKGKIG